MGCGASLKPAGAPPLGVSANQEPQPVSVDASELDKPTTANQVPSDEKQKKSQTEDVMPLAAVEESKQCELEKLICANQSQSPSEEKQESQPMPVDVVPLTTVEDVKKSEVDKPISANPASQFQVVNQHEPDKLTSTNETCEVVVDKNRECQRVRVEAVLPTVVKEEQSELDKLISANQASEMIADKEQVQEDFGSLDPILEQLDPDALIIPKQIGTMGDGRPIMCAFQTPKSLAIKAEADRKAGERAAAAGQAATNSEYPEWKGCGGVIIEDMLEHNSLVDMQYLYDLGEGGGVLPREQDLPASVKLDKEQIWRIWWRACDWTTLVVSYSWADACHPDRFGELLRRLLPIFQVMLNTAHLEAECRRGSTHNAIGVMIDYTYLPQRPREGAADEAKFRAGLKSLNKWYSHPYTNVLLCTLPLEGSGYTSTRPYDERGWCDFEMKVSSLVKDSQCLWDLSGFDGSEKYINDIRTTMRWGRWPPLDPDTFEQQLRDRMACGSLAFTYPKQDTDLVVRLFREGFELQFRDIVKFTPGELAIYYDYLDWGDEEAATLARTLEYMFMHECFPPVPILLEGNFFSASSKEILLKAGGGLVDLRF